MRTTTISLFTLFTLITLTSVGCYFGPEAETLYSCYDSCAVQEEAADCPAELAEDGLPDCYDTCDAISAAFATDDTCLAAQDAYFTCEADLEWVCLEGGEVPIALDAEATCGAEWDEMQTSCFGVDPR